MCISLVISSLSQGSTTAFTPESKVNFVMKKLCRLVFDVPKMATLDSSSIMIVGCNLAGCNYCVVVFHNGLVLVCVCVIHGVCTGI